MITFEELGLSPEILSAIKELGYEKPSPIQEKSIPLLLKDHSDLVALAQTGTGRIRIEALDTAEGFWKSVGFQRVKDAKLKDNSTYDMTIDADTVQALSKEISS